MDEIPQISLSQQGLSNGDIKVKNTGILRLQFFEDPPDGNLAIAEAQKNIPFEIRRVYFINELDSPEAIRGKHAHKDLKQVIFCINGTFHLTLDDGKDKQDVVMDDPYTGVVMDSLVWVTMTNFSPNCVILVLAEKHYEDTDYVRDYDEFLKLTR